VVVVDVVDVAVMMVAVTTVRKGSIWSGVCERAGCEFQRLLASGGCGGRSVGGWFLGTRCARAPSLKKR